MDWEQAMRTELFAPLKMRETGFGAPPGSGIWGRQTVNGLLQPVDPKGGMADNPAVLGPSGGVHVTPGDYARFLSLFLLNGSPLLNPATLEHLLDPPARALSYAGGWSLVGPPGNISESLTHNGSNTLWFATALIKRSQKIAYAAMTNQGGGKGKKVTDDLIENLEIKPAPG